MASGVVGPPYPYRWHRPLCLTEFTAKSHNLVRWEPPGGIHSHQRGDSGGQLSASASHIPSAKPLRWGKSTFPELLLLLPTEALESVSDRRANSATAGNADKPSACCWESQVRPWPSSILLASAGTE